MQHVLVTAEYIIDLGVYLEDDPEGLGTVVVGVTYLNW